LWALAKSSRVAGIKESSTRSIQPVCRQQKKANKLITYSHLYNLPTTGLRFFTVYGPWGRPDMALFKFTKAILAGEPIQVFNHGKHRRDFTYIDDIVEGVIRVLDQPAAVNPAWQGNAPDPGTSTAPWRV